MAFPSVVCLWGLQENEVRLESLGRQEPAGPKGSTGDEELQPPAGPRGLSTETESQAERAGEVEREMGSETEAEGGGRQTRACLTTAS